MSKAVGYVNEGNFNEPQDTPDTKKEDTEGKTCSHEKLMEQVQDLKEKANTIVASFKDFFYAIFALAKTVNQVVY